MALKPARDKIKSIAIKKHDNIDNHNLSKQNNRAENKKVHKLQKSKSWSQNHFYELDFSGEISNNIRSLNIAPEISAMGSYFGPNTIIPNYTLPYAWSQWDFIGCQIPNQLYTIPVPTVPVALISPPLPIIPTPVLPYTDILYTTTYSPIAPFVADNIYTSLDHVYEPLSSFAALTPVTSTDEDNETTEVETEQKVEPLEYYLTLPKDLFPRPKMLTLDPNPIIDELCKIKEIQKHSPWILDLEFGVPRTPSSRPVAVYDVQFNNIYCKNTPGAVHPVFEACSEEFQKVFLFYYDCIVSVWYRGYINLTNDDSVINFQNWLIVPVQALGMCWS